MKKEELLSGEFLKQFKNSKDFGSFMDELYTRGVEKMLEGELDAHLGYAKHQESDTENARNGYGQKTIRTKIILCMNMLSAIRIVPFRLNQKQTMMKKTFTTVLFMVIGLGICFAQTPIVSYQQSPDLGGFDYINDGVAGPSGAAYFTGSSDATGSAGGYDIVVTQIDANDGSVAWATQYGGAGTEYGRSIHMDPSGNLVVVGRTDSYAPDGLFDFGLMQLDASGNVNWSKSIGTDTTDLPWAVTDNNDGGYMVGGYTQPGQRTSMMLVKTQSNGTVDWARTIGSQFGNERLYDIVAMGASSGYLLIGYTGLYGPNLNDAMIVKTDDAGAIEAVFTFGGSGDDDARLYAEGNNSFYIGGNTHSFGVGQQDMFLAKFTISQLGLPSLSWLKTYGGAQNEEITDMAVVDDMLILLGHTDSYGTNGDIALIATDTADGSVLASYIYGGGQDEWANTLVPDENGLVLGGFTDSFNSDSDPYFIKLGDQGSTSCNNAVQAFAAVDQTSSITVVGPPTNSTDFSSDLITLTNDITTTVSTNSLTATPNQLCLTTGVAKAEGRSSLAVYPVPTNGLLNVDFPDAGTYQLSLYSVDGRLLSSESFTGSRAQLDLEGFTTGFYLLEVTGDNGSWTSRILKD